MKLFSVLVLSMLLSVPGSPSISAPEPDSIVVLLNHVQVQPGDPIHVQFKRFKVVKATFDPKKIEGGKATIEIDVTSLSTGKPKTDAQLQKPAFLNIPRFPKITIDIDKVKKKVDKTFTAEATVKYRAVTKKYPVTFDVVDATANAIRIKGEATFSLADFNMGKDQADQPRGEYSLANQAVIQLALTLKKT